MRAPIACAFLLASLFVSSSGISQETAVRPATHEIAVPAKTTSKPRIEVALLLDTSNSMDGLINQARTKLWKIVNEFESARRDGQRADVYVALYEYGNDRLSAEKGHIRQVVPLTLDLDKISEELFALTTNGGSEYCGQVIEQAVRELEWSDAKADLRCIFIAGNEPFTQGSVDYHDACRAAADKNITVSTIHCGSYDEGVNTMWADGAKLADGSYMHIDANRVEPNIVAPQDEQLAELNKQLNSTYCAYGGDEERKVALARQEAQDTNAAESAPAVASLRSVTKASRLYRNANWDLVDAVNEKKVELAKLDKQQLPEELRDLSTDQLAAHVKKLADQRSGIQEKIKKLASERAKYVAAERAKLAEGDSESLDDAIVESVRQQATANSFEFDER
ncbi:VWA domain-containing protein [Aeoliella sp. ICT_H6.2]|uniref:VWA domain-containing protein n=1 Tax=Aeoliella straminimaris TaxID=2954799 RepID=A0A9X2F683_9BACT|nr:vWA domain-containing protein [Aeoliella straminimaris]MCO6042519.1 VWA domain-containing protein [Aeoliella straminimaris]